MSHAWASNWLISTCRIKDGYRSTEAEDDITDMDGIPLRIEQSPRRADTYEKHYYICDRHNCPLLRSVQTMCNCAPYTQQLSNAQKTICCLYAHKPTAGMSPKCNCFPNTPAPLNLFCGIHKHKDKKNLRHNAWPKYAFEATNV